MTQAVSSFGAALRPLWPLDPAVIHLNHGSFGATPKIVLEAQDAIRLEIEANPSRFLWDSLEDRLAGAIERVALQLGGRAADWVFVDNATARQSTASSAAWI